MIPTMTNTKRIYTPTPPTTFALVKDGNNTGTVQGETFARAWFCYELNRGTKRPQVYAVWFDFGGDKPSSGVHLLGTETPGGRLPEWGGVPISKINGKYL